MRSNCKYDQPWMFCHYWSRKTSCWFHFEQHNSVPPIWNSVAENISEDTWQLMDKIFTETALAWEKQINKNTVHHSHVGFGPEYKDLCHHAEQLLSLRVQVFQPPGSEINLTKHIHNTEFVKQKHMPEIITNITSQYHLLSFLQLKINDWLLNS